MKRIIFLLIMLPATLFSQGGIQKAPLTVEQIWGTRTFFEKQPLSITQLNDNQHYLILDSEYKNIEKYRFRNGIEKVETLVDAAKFNLEYIDEYLLSNDESKMIVAGNSLRMFRYSYVSDLFLFDIKTNKIIEMAPEIEGKRDYSFSNDGNFVIYSHENNLYQYDIQTQSNHQLTFNGKYNEIINGTGDWVYEEEFSETKYYSISNDGRYLAYVSFEQFDVPPVILSRYYGQTYPDYEILKYPKVGENNSVVKLHIIDLKDKKSEYVFTQKELGKYEYLPRLKFSNEDNVLIIQTLNRKQDHLSFIKLQPSKSNGWDVKVVNEEKNDKYIEVEDEIYFIPKQKSFLTLSDRDGYKHLFKIDYNGKETLLTQGKFDIQDIYGFINDNEILFTAVSVDNPINTIIYSLNIKTKKIRKLSESENQSYGISSFKDGRNYFYGYYTTANIPKTIAFFDLKGSIITIQEDNSTLKHELTAYNLSTKTFSKMMGATDSLNVSIIQPSNFDPNKKYPVYIYIYGGPGANVVQNKYTGPDYMYHQLLAQRGYFVISIDPRGTLYRGSDFKKQTYGRLGELELEDFISITKELSKLPYIDKNRIGIQGWSYGGYMSSLAITKGADYFKTAIAVAPVTDWRFYDNVYTERYMNLLENNPEGYKNTSPMEFADKMKGKFLMIHGDADDNVHIQNAMEFANKLINLNKDFDYFVYPNKNHGIGGVRVHLYKKMLKFTLDNL